LHRSDIHGVPFAGNPARALAMVLACILEVLAESGCDDSLAEAQQEDSIAGWATYLETGPTGADRIVADARLEQLMWEAAESSRETGAWDRYLDRYPSGLRSDDARSNRIESAFTAATASGRPGDWEDFLSENSNANPSLRIRATRRRDALAYGTLLRIQDARAVTIAGATTIFAKVFNEGDRVIDYLAVGAVGTDSRAQILPVAVLIQPGRGIEGADRPLLPHEAGTVSGAAGGNPLADGAVDLVPLELGFAGWDQGPTESIAEIESDLQVAAAHPHWSGHPSSCGARCIEQMSCFDVCVTKFGRGTPSAEGCMLSTCPDPGPSCASACADISLAWPALHEPSGCRTVCARQAACFAGCVSVHGKQTETAVECMRRCPTAPEACVGTCASTTDTLPNEVE
jgi:hypothetical protein